MMKNVFAGLFVMFLLGCAKEGPTCVIAQFLDSTPGADVGVGDSALGGKSVAQSVLITVTDEPVKIKSVVLSLSKVGTVASGETVTLSLQQNSSGAPIGTPISSAASVSLETNDIEAVARDYTFTFPSSVSITTSGTYWLVLRASYVPATVNGSNQIKWIAHTGSDGYDDGVAKYLNSQSSWVADEISDTTDLVFTLGC